ncbi:DNA-binding SARP family transcriptional activator [Streptomyces aurantiacus]|uniref:AfsR/SARP family transcriptional regulator n=1 Tax=Streptomyces aurantiacus TaxID=47760 RepID=UPI0027921F7E|nr:AfsR/SARP family transcriptional regulator [Streptomyces aurantiacus]MDQ0772836.1 DNA-binding SARP family transcriptional activator [Streptomyces aurantiacus]
MRYEILGPPRVIDGNRYSSINARKVEIVLSVLLIRADQVVSLEQLMLEVWGEDLPRRATAGLHVYISQLRKFLKGPGTAESRVETRAPGYVLHKGDDEIDAHLFPQLVDAGRSFLREKRHDRAAQCLEDALALWRGPALGHGGSGPAANGPIIDGFSTWLTEVRLECQEMLAECQLQLGRHREAVGMLYALIAENPMREAFYRQLMLALYRSERQADALKVYQSVRKTLNDEMGLEPGRPLQAMQRAILAGDKRLMATSSVASGR